MGGDNTDEDVIVYGWDGTSLTPKDSKDHGTVANSVSWSPDGKYLAVGGINADKDVIVYEWNGTSLTPTDSKDHGSEANSVSWSPD